MKHQDTIIKLNADQFACITVTDLQTLKPIEANASAKILESKYGSVLGFFEHLFASGIKSVRIEERRCNGTSSKPDPQGQKYDIDLIAKDEIKPPVVAAPIPAPTATAAPDFALNGGMFGMNAVMQEMIYNTKDYHRVVAELAEAKAKNLALEAENKRLELQALKHEFGLDKKATENETMDKVLLRAPAVLQALGQMGLKFGPGAVAAAAAEVPMQGVHDMLSEVKTQLIQYVRQLDEDSSAYLAVIAANMSNEQFVEELDTILKKHNIIPAA